MIYLDNAATTRPMKSAIQDAEGALNELYFNPSASYAGGIQTHGEIGRAREEILSLVGGTENFGLIFTSCGTEADNQAMFGSVKRGNLVVSGGEHAAVYEYALRRSTVTEASIGTRFCASSMKRRRSSPSSTSITKRVR